MKSNLRPQTIAIIPARADSKRLADKNKLSLGGIPLVVHSIRYAKIYSDLIDRIMVTTNDSDIKAMARAEGAEVIERPVNISGDEATTLSALKHVIENLAGKVENVILLQPTNPLRPENLFREAFQKFEHAKCESLMTVSRSYKKLGKIEDHKFLPFNYRMGQRSQDLDPLYFENGLLYIIKASVILEGSLLGDKNFPFIVDHPFAAIDIDYKEDFEYAEFLMKKYSTKK